MSGTLAASTEDDDWNVFQSGIGVDVSINLPGVSVTFDPEFSNECESVAGIGFGFGSSALPSCGADDVYTVGKASSNNPNDGSVSFTYSETGGISGAISTNGVSKTGQAKIEGKVQANGNVIPAQPPFPVPTIQNSSASISSSGSYTFGISNLSATPYHAPGFKYVYR